MITDSRATVKSLHHYNDESDRNLQFITALVSRLTGRRDQQLVLTVRTQLIYRFGAQSTVTLLAVDGQPINHPPPQPTNYHAFQRVLDAAGAYIAQAEMAEGDLHAATQVQTYTLRFRGFLDLATGAFVDEPPTPPAPIDNPFVSPAYFHKPNTTRPKSCR